MSISQNLLYLLLLYAVLDRGNKLSLTTGLVLAFLIMLFNCYCGRSRNTCAISNNTFGCLNGFGV